MEDRKLKAKQATQKNCEQKNTRQQEIKLTERFDASQQKNAAATIINRDGTAWIRSGTTNLNNQSWPSMESGTVN